MHRYILLFFIFSFFGNMAMAQMAEGTTFNKRRKYACESLQKISENALIVRLTSNSRKIEQLKLMKKGKGISKKWRKKYEEQLKELEASTRQENELVVSAFLSEYDFSEILFMYDTATAYLSNGIQSGYFLNENLEIDSAINLDGREYFLVRYGYTTESGQKRTKGLIVLNEKYEDMPPPFPYKQFKSNINEAVGAKEEREEKLAHIKDLVREMDEEFGRYLSKCKYKRWMEEDVD